MDPFEILHFGFAVVGTVFTAAVVIDCCLRRDWKLLTMFVVALTLFLIAVKF